MFRYHPEAQAEFDAVLASGAGELVRCLAMAVMRHDLIVDGSEPLSALDEFIGPGRQQSRLYAVEYTASVVTWVEFFYETHGTETVVVAVDARLNGRPFGPRQGGDGKARARRRSR